MKIERLVNEKPPSHKEKQEKKTEESINKKLPNPIGKLKKKTKRLLTIKIKKLRGGYFSEFDFTIVEK